MCVLLYVCVCVRNRVRACAGAVCLIVCVSECESVGRVCCVVVRVFVCLSEWLCDCVLLLGVCLFV